MQATKDTFLNFLATKLQEMDAERTITVEGVARPAVLACENERAELEESFEGAYCVEWGGASAMGRGFGKLECAIRYWTEGSDEMSGVDRGRVLTEMDLLLVAMLSERRTAKLDLTKTPAVEMGSTIFWGPLQFEAAEQDGMKLKRVARLKVHYVAEEAA